MATFELNDWRIDAVSRPISNAHELDALRDHVRIPLPEMTYGNNLLQLTHTPSNWQYSFSARDALAMVKRGDLGAGDGAAKVGYADEWLSTRTAVDSAIPLPKTVPTDPYDWTYTTTYSGTDTNSTSSFTPADPQNPEHTIPFATLTRRDPILYFAEIPLFEDELHDNGSAHLTARIRVMPACFFLLLRFVLRVDNVLFRVWDTRIFHAFKPEKPLVVRECKGWEASYDLVKQFLPDKDDLSSLTDSNFISQTLAALASSKKHTEIVKTDWRGANHVSLDVANLVPKT